MHPLDYSCHWWSSEKKLDHSHLAELFKQGPGYSVFLRLLDLLGMMGIKEDSFSFDSLAPLVSGYPSSGKLSLSL